MTTSTRNEPNDRDAARFASGSRIQGKTKTSVRCRLCGQTNVLESDFRPTASLCPHCGLKFVFDPQEQPLPVHGIRLRLSEVVEAQRRGRSGYHRRHEAHVPSPVAIPQKKSNFLAWTGTVVFALAGIIALFGMLRR